jgi:membrane protein YqaA with SNARE-associated domain
LKTIKHILSRYTAFLWALLKPLGAWGVFAIGAVDASFFGLPLDGVVAGYVYQNRSLFLLYVFMASAGSALGSIVLYVIGYKGGEELLRKRVSPERFERLHQLFEKHPVWGLVIPAMLPPPTPFKLLTLAAAVSEMKLSHFLLAIFAGRFLRFLGVAWLTMKYGPDIVRVSGTLFREHLQWLLGAVAAGLMIWLIVRRIKGKKKSSGSRAENSNPTQGSV